VQGGILNFEVLRSDGSVFSYKTLACIPLSAQHLCPYTDMINRAMFRCHAPPPTQVQGGILNFEVLRPDGSVFSYSTFCSHPLLQSTTAT
jgi:hypothetical protein